MGQDPVRTVVCCLLVVGVIVGLILLARKRPPREDDSAPASSVPRSGGGIQFDPLRPEELGEAARQAFDRSDFLSAFNLYVKAIDSLDDLYGYEQFRQRQPSPADAWLVDGMTRALGLALRQDPHADVVEGVRMATGRLRRIARLTEAAGGNSLLYRQALGRLAELGPPDVDVSDIDP